MRLAAAATKKANGRVGRATVATRVTGPPAVRPNRGIEMKGRKLLIVFGNPTTYFVNGVEITEAEYREQFPSKLQDMVDSGKAPDGHRPGIWPMYSEALAVHPTQVDEANARAAKNGLGVRYEKGTGVCEIASDGDKVKLVNLEGFVNKQAGFR